MSNGGSLKRMSARHLILMFGIVALSGCAVMTPEQCEYADWAMIGEQDARQGRAADYIARRAKDCDKAGFPPDAEAYRYGWEQGITRFCHPERGFQEGLRGRSYEYICPAGLEPDFLAGYTVGTGIHRARAAVAVEAEAIRELEELLYTAENLSDSKIDELRNELANRREHIRRLERELGQLEGQAAALGYQP